MDRARFESFVDELKNSDNNCIVVKGYEVLRFSHPGVKSLMGLLNDYPEKLKGSYVFDTIVGRVAAALMILGGVKEIYAEVISDNAANLLDKWDLKYSYGRKVPYIENRMKNGLCPMESLSLNIDDPKEIYERISGFITEMQSKKNQNK